MEKETQRARNMEMRDWHCFAGILSTSSRLRWQMRRHTFSSSEEGISIRIDVTLMFIVTSNRKKSYKSHSYKIKASAFMGREH